MLRVTLVLLALFGLYYIYNPLPFGVENYDGYELITAMVTGGIGHAPGYGIYLEINRWFHSLLSLWGFEPALSMTYFQCFCSFLAILIFIRMIELWQGNTLLFLLLMMCCNPFTQNLNSVEVYGFLTLLLALSLKLYFFKISNLSIWLQDLILGLVLGLMVSHHLSLAPLAVLMVYRRCLESRFSIQLILGLIPGPLLHILLNYEASQSPMNPWFDGRNLESFIGHLSANAYQMAFLDWGIHLQAFDDFISVWPAEVWLLIILSLVLHVRQGRSQIHVAILLILIWPLFVYNIPDISKPLVTFYIVVAVIVSCTELKVWMLTIFLILCGMHSFKKAEAFKLSNLNYKVRAMEQNIKDAYFAVHKNPKSNHIFMGYDSTFGIAYARHVLESETSKKMAIFPLWWLSYFPHLGSLKNYGFSSDKKREEVFHWTGLSKSQLIKLYAGLYEVVKDLDHTSIFPRPVEFEQLKLSLDILNDRNSIFYMWSGKPDLMIYLRDLGYGFINNGFWNRIKLKKDLKYQSKAIVQRVNFQKYDDQNYFVNIIFLEEINDELEFKLTHKGKAIASKIKVSGQEKTFFRLPIEDLIGSLINLEIYNNDRKLLSAVTLVID